MTDLNLLDWNKNLQPYQPCVDMVDGGRKALWLDSAVWHHCLVTIICKKRNLVKGNMKLYQKTNKQQKIWCFYCLNILTWWWRGSLCWRVCLVLCSVIMKYTEGFWVMQWVSNYCPLFRESCWAILSGTTNNLWSRLFYYSFVFYGKNVFFFYFTLPFHCKVPFGISKATHIPFNWNYFLQFFTITA